jgi:hypothetical protein
MYQASSHGSWHIVYEIRRFTLIEHWDDRDCDDG